MDGDSATEEKLGVPRPLVGYFAFASAGLPWHGVLKRTREFLEDLVSPYDSETVLTRISQVVHSGASAEQVIAGLRWAFAIWRRAADGGRPITIQKQHRLLVPTTEQELISASEAVFSESWPEETLGRRLQQFFNAAPVGVADLMDLRKRLIAATDHRAFGKGRIGQWTEFLTALGVKRGLALVEKPAESTFRARELASFAFCEQLGISERAAQIWKADISRYVPNGTSFNYSTNYEFRGKLWWLPGQGDHESFSNDCREIYAALVVEWLGRASNDVFMVVIRHVHFTSDWRQWSTPLAAFLRSAKWIPADDPSSSGPVRDYFEPSDVWIGPSGDRVPVYLRQPAPALTKAIERGPPAGTERLTYQARLRVLNKKETLIEQANFLADQYRRGTVSRHYEPQFANLYGATWKAIVDRYDVDPRAFAGVGIPPPLLARRGREFVSVDPNVPNQPRVYVRDNEDEVAPGLINAVGGLIFDVKGADRGRVGRILDALFGNRVHLISKVRFDVRADDLPIDELPHEPLAFDVCPWLRPMLAVALEALKGTEAARLPSDRSSLLAKLMGVGLHFAKDLIFFLDGAKVLPDDARPAYMFRRGDGTPLVVARHQGAVTWSIIETCLPSICDALDLPSIATSMRLLARDLMTSGAPLHEAVLDRADMDRLCRTLYLDDQASAAANYLLSERLDARLPWIRAVVYLSGRADALEAWHSAETSTGGDPDLLRAALVPLLAAADLTAEALIEACRQSFSIAQLREQLGLDFATLNASLVASGSEPDTYPEMHVAQLLNYVTDHEVAIIEGLRNAVAPALDRREAAPAYARLRDAVRGLSPAPEWLLLYKIVPDELVAARVAEWLERAGAPMLGANPHNLPSLQAVRAANVASIARFTAAAAPLVRTWCAARGRAAPEVWSDTNAAEGRVHTMLDAAGVFDYRPLDEEALLAWCAVLGLWPKDMDKTLDRVVLKIETTDIEAAKRKAREEADERAAKARSVRFNGRDIDPLEADWTTISEEIAANLSKRAKARALGKPADLMPVEKRGMGDKKKNRPPPGRFKRLSARIPQEKKDMIGRLGEIAVYHWLKERFPNQDIDKAWVSRNGVAQTGRPGSDEYGFDFEVEYRKQTWQIEVKASVGDHQQFEMGETEVRAAREAARPRSNIRYVVVYVADPHEPINAQIDVLPNPMSAEADGVLDLLGEGVRFGFKRR